MIHKEISSRGQLVMMWCDFREKGKQTIKFNYRDNVSDGDIIEVGSIESKAYYHIERVIETRDSSMTGYNYITALAIRKNTI